MVKLADRLHNMRTIKHVEELERRHRIARETMDIYAPLASRIGMQDIKDELEDLAFAELNREARDSIIRRLNFLREEGGNLVDRVISELNQVMIDENIIAAVSGREKTAYSIWQKMQRQQVEFEQLSDIMAFRIIVNNSDQCYKTLGIIHGRYSAVPGRFRDYLSTPKPNGYQSYIRVFSALKNTVLKCKSEQIICMRLLNEVLLLIGGIVPLERVQYQILLYLKVNNIDGCKNF